MIPASYGDADAREAELDAAAEEAGAEVVVCGSSVEGRPIRAAVAASSSPSAPTILVDANIHGVEWIGARCALGFLRALSHTHAGTELRKRASVVVVPCVNPDGWMRTQQQAGKGTLKQVRCNANGVDLNRNFPMPHDAKPFFLSASGSSSTNAATYRGTAPFSEPEARAVDALAQQHRFHACLSFHSFMGTLIPPKVTTAHDAATYRRLCRAYRRGQTRFYAPTFMFAPLDVFTGELEDHLHHVHRCWSVTVEVFPLWRSFAQHVVAPSIFQRFNPDEGAEAFVEDAVAGSFSFFSSALDAARP